MNKRIRKKHEKAAKYRARVELVGNLAMALCPDNALDEYRALALALWKRDDVYLGIVADYIMGRSTPVPFIPLPLNSPFVWRLPVGYDPTIDILAARTQQQ